MNLYQKLVEVRKSIPYLQKDKRAYNYNYASGTQVLTEVRKKIDEFGLLLVPSIIESKYHDVLDDKGKQERLVILEMRYTWINADNPEEQMNVPWQSMGQNAREKGLGSALTYAERYFLLKFFSVPTDDLDPDEYKSEYGDTATTQQQQQRGGKQSQTEHERKNLLDEIAREMSRTQAHGDAIHKYCDANNIPRKSSDCTIQQLRAILQHFKSIPTPAPAPTPAPTPALAS